MKSIASPPPLLSFIDLGWILLSLSPVQQPAARHFRDPILHLSKTNDFLDQTLSSQYE